MKPFDTLKTGKKATSRLRVQSKKAGLPPGSVVHTGEQKVDTVRITVLDYDDTQFQERQLDRIEEAFKYKSTPTVSWINIDGLHDVSVIEEIGKHIPNVPMLGALLKAFYLVSETEFADALGKWLSKTLPLNIVEANLKAFTQGFQTANKVK